MNNRDFRLSQRESWLLVPGTAFFMVNTAFVLRAVIAAWRDGNDLGRATLGTAVFLGVTGVATFGLMRIITNLRKPRRLRIDDFGMTFQIGTHRTLVPWDNIKRVHLSGSLVDLFGGSFPAWWWLEWELVDPTTPFPELKPLQREKRFVLLLPPGSRGGIKRSLRRHAGDRWTGEH